MSKSAPTKSTTKKTTPPFSFHVRTGNGSTQTWGRKIPLTTAKPPQRWTALDLWQVLQQMADIACKRRRQPATWRTMSVQMSSRFEGTQVYVSQTAGAWCYLPSQFHIPAAAIGALAAESYPNTVHMDVTAKPPTPAAVERQRKRTATFLAKMVAQNGGAL